MDTTQDNPMTADKVGDGAFTGRVIEIDGVAFGVPSSVAQTVIDALRIYRAWQGAAVVPVTRQVNPLPARPPLEWDHPSFVTTYARLLECDESGNLVPDGGDDGQAAA